MKKITLNLEQIKNKEELYAILKKKMQLKADNLDGMYQYLTATADPMTLTMTGVGTFKNEMGNYAGSLKESSPVTDILKAYDDHQADRSDRGGDSPGLHRQ